MKKMPKSDRKATRQALDKPQPGYWLELERIEVPNDSRDGILLIAVSAITGERNIIGRI